MEKMMRNIGSLNDSLESNLKSRKVIETRLENRYERPGIELCADTACAAQNKESKALNCSRQSIEDKFNSSKAALNSLEKHLHSLEDDLRGKERALMIDARVLDVRKRLQNIDTQRNNCRFSLDNLKMH